MRAYFGATRRTRLLLANPAFFNLRSSIEFYEVNASYPFQSDLVSLRLLTGPSGNAKNRSTSQSYCRNPKHRYETQGARASYLRGLSRKVLGLGYRNKWHYNSHSEHCELTLALHHSDSPNSSQALEIGISKRSCWLCQQFLGSLSKCMASRILVSENQGKVHSGWAMPPRTPESVKEEMCGLIDWEIHDIRERVIARRRSDSFPNSDREGETSEFSDDEERIRSRRFKKG